MSTRLKLLFSIILTTCAAQAHAQASTTLPLETHAGFYSREVGLTRALDPQVFVADDGAPAGIGPQGITHAAGMRNAFVDESDNRDLFDAHGEPLHMTLSQWLGATGTVMLSPQSNGTEKIDVSLSRLKPGALYSLFENHFEKNSVRFTPLDGSGKGNSFRADSQGAANIHVVAPAVLTHENAVLVVLHSDGIAHGDKRGNLGVDAHHQLIARLP
ncbi:hypothetical protein P3T43_001419 [Paraburkholderia sp. GAS41]|uniref:hypothetical protein n=1 Tax=Paraburkholderia sp. GAS41 TaxID=3035134 RepID=UPI003D1FF270